MLKKLFCSQQISSEWIHEDIIINNEKKRLYNTGLYGCEQIFWNEIGQFFLDMLNKNLKIYYIRCTPKHDVLYDQSCFDFFKLFRETYDNTLEIPENLKKLREMQYNDLMNFYDNLILESFFIISKIKDHLYYYDMIIIVKNDYNINDFLKINFNTVYIKNILPIYNYNIDYNIMQQWFDFEQLNSYNFCHLLTKDYYNIINNLEFKELREYKIFSEYENEQYEKGNINMQHNNPLYWQYSNEYEGAVSEITNQKEMFKHYFSMFGFQWFVLNYNFEDTFAVEAQKYTYPINEVFLLTLDSIAIPSAILKANGKVERFNQEYDFGSMFELLALLNGCDNYCVGSSVISVPKIKYNTSYKCRLNKN